jgi:hypothetical protein
MLSYYAPPFYVALLEIPSHLLVVRLVMMVEKLLFQQEKGLNWGSSLLNKVLFTKAM